MDGEDEESGVDLNVDVICHDVIIYSGYFDCDYS